MWEQPLTSLYPKFGGKGNDNKFNGIDSECLVWDDKAALIAEQSSGLVGDTYFWMDVLCVEQREKAARVAVTQHIPTIFRNAQRTIVVRDSARLLCSGDWGPEQAMGTPRDTLIRQDPICLLQKSGKFC